MISALSPLVQAQKFLSDTIWVDFKQDTIVKLPNIAISEVVDNRHEDPRFIRYISKKKWLFIPVDREIYTNEPLGEELEQSFNMTIGLDEPTVYELHINKFSIEIKKNFFRYQTLLVSDIAVYKITDTVKKYRGTLYYNFPYNSTERKESLRISTENLLNKWHTDLKLDMVILNGMSGKTSLSPKNKLLTDISAKSLYLNTVVSGMVGFNWWGMQIDLFFSRPETTPSTTNNKGLLRYMNTEKVESVALGRQVPTASRRLNSDFLIDFEFDMLLGFNKWKNLEESKPQIYQMFNVNVSALETISYSPKNKNGVWLKLGLVQGVFYIYNKSPVWQLGMVGGIGFKL